MAINYRYNVMTVGSVSTFARIRGGCNQGNRDVYFLRFIGGNDTLKQEIQEMDALLSVAMEKQQLLYHRLSTLPNNIKYEDQEYYVSCYEKWMESDGAVVPLRSTKNNDVLSQSLGFAFQKVGSDYDKLKPGNSSSMKRNFIIKLMHWMEFILADIPVQWTERSYMKIVADNVTKPQEYLFYYMLTLIGADVVLLQTKQDIEIPDWLDAYSKKCILGAYVTWNIPEYIHASVARKADTSPKHTSVQKHEEHVQPNTNSAVRITIPERTRKTKQQAEPAVSDSKEKDFEELALLASSVVMITIHDKTGEPIGSGSGIMIAEDGYILTNYHVIRNGCFYSVQIEDDENVYTTNELIKYHSVEDLAIIHIDRPLNPLPIYRGTTELVRGQKVVAIGSPLGLFNSVSNGIISGFRTIDTVDMMQFTAPISHGSSGGAVLNMSGEVIGISTAGIDQGQNINLAVLYKTILYFTQGFAKA